MGVVTTRRIEQLRAECDTAGIEYSEADGREVLMDKLRIKLGAFDATTEIDPMKAKETKSEIKLGPEGADYSKLADRFTDRYVMEPKLDGARCRLFVGLTGSTINSGRRSVRTFAYTNRTENFPHLSEIGGEDLAGIILDGEIIAPTGKIQTHTGTWTNSLLNASVALMNSNPQGSVQTQKRFGKAQLWVFDVLSGPGGESLMDEPYETRRMILEKVVELLQSRYPECEIRLIPQLPSTEETIRETMLQGFEGVVIKDVKSKYVPGKRTGWWKVKTFSSADSFVVGWEPGESSNTGLVGSLNLAVDVGPALDEGMLELSQQENYGTYQTADGETRVYRAVAQVGNLVQKWREQISAEDGSLREEYYGIVIEWVAQGLGKNGRARHAHMIRLRPDKTPVECDPVQLDIFPAV